LASLLCVRCHLNPSTGRLTGKLLSDLPPEFGRIVSEDITRSRKQGGAWSDGDLARAASTKLRKLFHKIRPGTLCINYSSSTNTQPRCDRAQPHRASAVKTCCVSVRE